MNGIREYGDFQTPSFFVSKVCEYLHNNIRLNPDIVVEPTCGDGNFLAEANRFWKHSKLYGIEISDDTCYFICFDDYDEAYVAMLILNSKVVQSFLSSIAFLDSKRPYTKKILSRVDLSRAVQLLTLRDLEETEQLLACPPYIDSFMYEKFQRGLFEVSQTPLFEMDSFQVKV